MSKTLGTRARILVADDEPEIRHVLSDLLSPALRLRRRSGRPRRRWSCCSSGGYDLVISDIMMGGMSGLELIPHVRSFRPTRSSS